MILPRTLPPTACIFAALVIATPTSAHAQQERTLGPADATYEEPFTLIGAGNVRELSDGRLIVADPKDKLLQIIDLNSGASVAIGREGSGPAEFGLPLRLFAAPGDTTLVFDPLNSRYLVLDAAAKPVNSFRIESGGSAGPGAMRMSMAIARASDARGRLYYEASGLGVGPDGRPQSPDSAALLRYDRALDRTDTLGWVKLPENNVQVSGGANNRSVMIGSANPLSPRDEWSVFPDGRVAIVRAADYHVDWVMPDGTKSSTPAVRFASIRMTAAQIREEEALRVRAQQSAMRMMVTMDNGARSMQAGFGPPPGAPPLEPLTNWPEVMPPFRPGMQSTWARPNGELWVRRTEPAGAKGTLYDVIDARGIVTHRVRVPEGWNVVGMGDGTVYTVRHDEDDLAYLQRHRLK